MKFEYLIENEFSRETNRTIKIIDIGSGCIWRKIEFLFSMFKNKFEYTAVDKKTECSIFYQELDEENQCEENISTNDWITSINQRLKFNGIKDIEIVNESLFQKSCKLNFNTDVIEFIDQIKENNKYDIILLSNVLHFIERDQANSILSICKAMLTQNGLLYVCVLNDQQIDYKRVNLYNIESFNRMKYGLVDINESLNTFHYEFTGRKI